MIGVLAVPGVTGAQPQGRVWRIGLLVALPRPAPGTPYVVNDFIDELGALGYREGQNIIVEWRSHRGQVERRHQEAAAIVAWKPDVVVTTSGSDGIAFRNLSPSLPIVVAAAGDLVGMGLAKTLAQPGGNITGSQILSTDLAAKRLQLFKELMPSCERFGLLHQAVQAEEAAYYVRLFAELQAAGREASLRIRSFAVTSDADFESAFAAMKRERLEALIVASNPFMFSHRQRLAELAARHQLPVMHEYAEYVAAGGLLAYGVKLGEFWRRAAHFVDRILRGSKPADLPIEQPKTLELVINLKTAKALGLTIPGSLLLRADQLIE